MIARPLAVLAAAAALTVALAGCSRTGDSAAPPASSRAASVTAEAPVSPGAPVAPAGPSATASAAVTPSTTVTIDLSGINAAVSQANKDVSAGDSARAQPDGS